MINKEPNNILGSLININQGPMRTNIKLNNCPLALINCQLYY